MSASVYYAVLKHFGTEAFDQAILHHVADILAENGYHVECDISDNGYEISNLAFSNMRTFVGVSVEYINEVIKLEAIAHVCAFSGEIQKVFFEEFPSLKQFKDCIFPLKATDKNLLHIQHVIDLKRDGVFNFENKASEFIGFSDMISNELMKKAVFLSFLNSDEINSLKYGM